MLSLTFKPTDSTLEVLQKLAKNAQNLGLEVIEIDTRRPWGGELIFNPNNLSKFLKLFYPEYTINKLGKRKVSLKYLVLAPGKRFSWQYHQRRDEVWKAVAGPLGVYLSQDDVCPEKAEIKETGDLVVAKCGTRHRIQGLDNWGVMAEIWIHTDPNNPSTEDDNTRLHDDFGRH